MERTNQTLGMAAIIVTILVAVPLVSVLAAEDNPYESKRPLIAIMGPITAKAYVNSVLIEWESLIEFDIIGYHLERARSQTGPWAQLNASLIPCQEMGQVIGSKYEYLDTYVEPGATYFYRLVIVDKDATLFYEEPVQAIVPIVGEPYEPYIPPIPSSYHRTFVPLYFR